MNVVIINDCRDANAIGRQTARAASLLGGSVSFIGVASDLQAAGNIIDALDALEESPGVIIANVAPRNGTAKRWENGTPFGYFWYRKILILASIDDLTLSLVKKFKLTKVIYILDIPKTLDQLIAGGALPKEVKDSITETQFRSYVFLPRVAAFLAGGKKLQGTRLHIKDIPDAPPAIWWIDNFGNCKTTFLYKDIKDQIRFSAKFNKLPYFARLKDVPDKTPAIISGSSGLGEKRFLEIVIQGGSAEKEFDISVGDVIATNKANLS
ncbi:hypothetical protein HYS29_02135 [Candidatus Microgenomates bacterium]|nr:hypothetical protein [Candidatus Microgenomates bacterium]